MQKIFETMMAILSLFTTISIHGQRATLELKKASAHPIQYYISLPANWSSKSMFPVVIVLEDAHKEFKKNAERFIAASKDMPFIIVAPFITTNGQQGHKDSTIYPYSKSVWDSIDKISVCKFDMDGLQNIIKDVRTTYSGSEKVFITGFEAGTHLVWAMIFHHPESLYAAAPVAGNYRGRCMESNTFSENGSSIQLPIKNFTGSEDKDFGTDGRIYNQYLEAKNLALLHGYKNISETEVVGKSHVPLPDEVLKYFDDVWKRVKK